MDVPLREPLPEPFIIIKRFGGERVIPVRRRLFERFPRDIGGDMTQSHRHRLGEGQTATGSIGGDHVDHVNVIEVVVFIVTKVESQRTDRRDNGLGNVTQIESVGIGVMSNCSP